MHILKILVLSGLAFACGKVDEQEITQTPIPGAQNITPTSSTSMLVETQTQKPACLTSNEAQLIFVRETATFESCSSGNWTKINMAGSSGKLEFTLACVMSVSKEELTASGLDNAPDSGVIFNYTVNGFTNNTAYVHSRITSGSNSYASGVFWDAATTGYKKMQSDDLVFDIHGASDFGYWFMTRDSSLTGDENEPFAIVYSDPAFESGKALVFNSKEDCKLFSYQ